MIMCYRVVGTSVLIMYSPNYISNSLHSFTGRFKFESQMASTDDSDDSSEDGPQYSAIIQPPLIKQLRKILDEYPDGGQI
jgi:hypothetical protein